MAQAYTQSPSTRTTANRGAEHCKRLEQLNLQSAGTLRELAAHHTGLAAGQTSAVPRGTSGFERGDGARAPSAAALTTMASKAATPADHRALEEYFVTSAKRYTAEANDHAAMALAYRGTRIAQSAAHCERLATLSRDAAKEATAGAAMHKQLAGVAR